MAPLERAAAANVVNAVRQQSGYRSAPPSSAV
jgi:hypothetical protein